MTGSWGRKSTRVWPLLASHTPCNCGIASSAPDSVPQATVASRGSSLQGIALTEAPATVCASNSNSLCSYICSLPVTTHSFDSQLTSMEHTVIINRHVMHALWHLWRPVHMSYGFEDKDYNTHRIILFLRKTSNSSKCTWVEKLQQ